MRVLNIIVLLLAATATSAESAASKPARPFRAEDYPPEKFRISRQEYPLGDLLVRVINVKNLGEPAAAVPSFCGAWVEVLRAGQFIRRISYDDIEPVGFSFGAFVPKRQPKDYFAVVKSGDYDGRLLLVNREGGITDIPGGFYFLSADGRYVVSEYASDDSEPGFTVFDFRNQRTVLQPKDTPELGSWYRDDAGYFVMEYGQPGRAERLDLVNGRVVKFKVTADARKKAARIPYDFDPRNKQDCLSTPQ